jgi:hypothetical protein
MDVSEEYAVERDLNPDAGESIFHWNISISLANLTVPQSKSDKEVCWKVKKIDKTIPVRDNEGP